MTSTAFLAVAGAGSSNMLSSSPGDLVIITICCAVAPGIGFNWKQSSVKVGI